MAGPANGGCDPNKVGSPPTRAGSTGRQGSDDPYRRERPATGHPDYRDVLVRPDSRYAETAAPARAVTPGGELRAVGVRAYLDQERLELLSEVRGVCESPKP